MAADAVGSRNGTVGDRSHGARGSSDFRDIDRNGALAYIVRVSFTLGQSSRILGDLAAKNGSKKTVVVQSDWAPGAEATAVFADHFEKERR